MFEEFEVRWERVQQSDGWRNELDDVRESHADEAVA